MSRNIHADTSDYILCANTTGKKWSSIGQEKKYPPNLGQTRKPWCQCMFCLSQPLDIHGNPSLIMAFQDIDGWPDNACFGWTWKTLPPFRRKHYALRRVSTECTTHASPPLRCAQDNIHGNPWTSMAIYGFRCHENPWIAREINGDAWMSMDHHGPPWISMIGPNMPALVGGQKTNMVSGRSCSHLLLCCACA